MTRITRRAALRSIATLSATVGATYTLAGTLDGQGTATDVSADLADLIGAHIDARTRLIANNVGDHPTAEQEAAWKAANDSEAAAMLALCSYRCTSMVDIAAKAQHIADHQRMGWWLSDVDRDALVQSMAAADVDDENIAWVHDMRRRGWIFVRGATADNGDDPARGVFGSSWSTTKNASVGDEGDRMLAYLRARRGSRAAAV